MTRGAQQAPNADIQAGNGAAHPPRTTPGRGRMGNWLRARPWTRARSWIRAGAIAAHPRSSTPGRGRLGNWLRARTRTRARTWIRAKTRTRARTWIRAGAIAGIIGPAAFTVGWIVAALRQPGLSFSAAQISGLASVNARDPWVMIGGFLLLGAGAISFGAALRAALGGRQAGAAPWLIQLAGALTIAAGLLRRDHVLLTGGPESWHNQAHNIISAAAYLLLVAAPLLLAWRFRRDRQWSRLAAPLVAAAVVATALLAALYAAPNDSWAATLQRFAVSLPLVAIVAVAIRLIRLAGSADPVSPGGTDAVGRARPGQSRQPE